MKTLLATAAIAAALALAGPVSAQTMHSRTTIIGTPSWMIDDGSSSDYPVHMPGDISGDRLNSQYIGGILVPPGMGFPAR